MSFHATAGTMGNSKGLRLDAALYREHPEFSDGSFTVDVIAPGRMLVRAETAPSGSDASDPIVDAFLGFLENNMAARPELITPMRASDATRIRELIGGVEISENEAFDESFSLP